MQQATAKLSGKNLQSKILRILGRPPEQFCILEALRSYLHYLKALSS